VASSPVLFTVEFRRKMAELPQPVRQQWLTSLAARSRGSAADEPVQRQELREVARACRLSLVEAVEKQLGGSLDPLYLQAVLDVPRERFVRPEDIERSAEDVPLPLDDEGFATVSAPHAYLMSFRLLKLEPGDSLVELGTGTGYGAALAAYIVGSRGSVLTFEIDERLFAQAQRNLAVEPNVTVVHGDAMSAPSWGGRKKVVVTFAVETVPDAWVAALPEGGALVVPVGPPERDQRLVLASKRRGVVEATFHGAVRYVKNRSNR
jgi:protein-L-isoaspartate(D-aspartate) O-methyltransferase